MNADLFGVIEWICEQENSSVTIFNPGVLVGTVYGFPYRYFVHEGWIGLIEDGHSSRAVDCRHITEFRHAVAVAIEKKRAAST